MDVKNVKPHRQGVKTYAACYEQAVHMHAYAGL